MKKEHQEIINLLTEYLIIHPDQRFGQAIFNLGINEFANKTQPDLEDYRFKDIYNDSDSLILERIKNRLEILK